MMKDIRSCASRAIVLVATTAIVVCFYSLQHIQVLHYKVDSRNQMNNNQSQTAINTSVKVSVLEWLLHASTLRSKQHGSNNTAPDNQKSNTIIEKPLILWHNIGRLGNHLFHYAAAYVIAQKSGHSVTIKSTSPLTKIFPHLSGHQLTQQQYAAVPAEGVHEAGAGIFTAEIANKVKNKSHINLVGYYQSWKYFQGYENEIRKQFKLNPEILKTAKADISNLIVQHKKTSINSSIDLSKVIHIGVHVRRGDMTLPRMVARGYVAAPIEYIRKAMDYYRTKHKNVLFIVCSDDIEWSKSNIENKHLDTLYVHNSQYVKDFGILVSCSHSVITTGSFSWWAGWLTGGQVVYYSKFPKPGTEIGSFYKPQDYYPPNWIPMTE